MNSSGLGRHDRRLAVSIPSAPLPVEGDRVRLVQVVSNLLNNAVRFTDAEGHIALSVVPSGDRAEIRVQDDGRGIPPDRLTDIFEMFFQVESGRGGALGIGLTLVQSLVALHGGTVHAESEGPGHGAAFVVSLPLSPGAPPPPKPRWEAPAETPAMTQRRVLVVDDNRDIADSLRLLLTMLKAEVRVAYDGAESIRICRDWEPTHVLMDLGMPGMDGFEAARRLRADHPDRAFRLIAVSGWGREEDRRQSRRAGFDQHLVKPVGIAELKALLSE
jgi:CheY-like chemotaxis protein/anti-sigma regulatory factor (Ser/Thr protein kinase)